MAISGIVFLLLLSTQMLVAQDAPELITDRPDQTESSRVVPGGSVQVEVGAMYKRDEAHEHDEEFGNFTMNATFLTAPSVLLRVGVTDWLELRGLGEYDRVEVRFHFNKNIGDSTPPTVTHHFPLGLGAKVQLLDESGPAPETALITHFLIPYSFKSVRPEFVFTMSHTLTPALGLGYNIGAEWNLQRKHLEPFYTVSLGADLSERIGAYVELFGGWDPDTESFHSFDVGLTWLVQNNLQLDISRRSWHHR